MFKCFTKILIIYLFFFIKISYSTPRFVEGMIPLKYGRRPATDLIFQGKRILPNEIHKLYIESSGKFDISSLDPDDTSILWKNIKKISLEKFSEAQISISDNNQVDFMNFMQSRSGNFRFIVGKRDEFGSKKTYIVMLSKKIHNVLLRKNLLRKLGYKIPEIKYIRKLRLKFRSSVEKEVFFDRLAESTFGDPQRWILNYKDHKKRDGKVSSPLEFSDEISIDDVIVMESNIHYYNLALGFLPSSIIKGRRLLNSLIIPYSLVEVPESINLLPWHMGRIVNKQVKLDYQSAEEFTCTYNDAKWIINRILKLERNDFKEIVEKAYFPKAVELLLIEKLIARRNSLKDLFNIEDENIHFDSRINYQSYLRQGKLLREKWDGYASRFAYGDPASPLSRSEIFAFIKSKIISTVINNFMMVVNKFIPKINIEKALFKKQQEKFFKQLQNYIKTGKVVPVPVGIWAFPIFGINLIASRDIIAGSYLGTDNLIQLADSVGFNIDIGAFLNVEGIEVPWNVTGTVKGTFTRTYTHLRPIKSFKASLKYPFKNLIVPLLKRKYAQIFSGVSSNKLSHLAEEERQKKISNAVKLFKEKLSIGESILITDSVGAGINIDGGIHFEELLRAQAAFGADQIIISRLHIHRKDENTIQIYKDIGNLSSLILSYNLKALVPFFSVSARLSAGKSRCKFYKLNINPNEQENPNILKIIRSLVSLFKNNSLEGVSLVCDPYYLVHNFSEGHARGRFLFFQLDGLNSKTLLSIKHPEGTKREYVKCSNAKRAGINIEEFIINSIASVLLDYTDWDIHLSNVTSSNPGDSVQGASVNQVTTFEGEIDKKWKYGLLKKGSLKNIFARISETWKGWSIKSKNAKKIINRINNRFNFKLYNDLILNQTRKLFLFNIRTDIFIYEKALNYMFSLRNYTITSIFKKHCIGLGRTLKRWRFIDFVNRYRRNNRWGFYHKSSNYAKEIISMANKWLSFEGLKKLFGGPDNFFVSSTIQGFRVGDEAGDSPLYSHTIGEFGSRDIAGPLAPIVNSTGMIHSEFFAYWIRGFLF